MWDAWAGVVRTYLCNLDYCPLEAAFVAYLVEMERYNAEARSDEIDDR